MKRTNIQNIAIVTFIAILIAVGIYLFKEKSGPSDELKTYTNKTYGVTFTYPKDYKLEERTVTGPETGTGTVVVITEDGLSIPIGGEGPTAITIGMYPQGVVFGTGDPVEAWIRNTPASNFSVATGALGTTTVGGNEAWLYTWDGLYQGTTLVTDHNGTIVMLSVTYDGEADLEKREVFSNLVQNIQFIEVDRATSTVGDPNAVPEEATLRGVYECLPLKSGGAAGACSPGIRADNGNHYALDLGTVQSDLVATRKGTRIQVVGPLVPIEQISTDIWQKYNVKGIMKVEAFERI